FLGRGATALGSSALPSIEVSMPPTSDVGIVLYASQDGSGSFTKADGNPGTVRTITNANFIASDWFDVGRFADLFITVAGVISGGMTSVVVMIERRRSDTV